MNQIFSKVRVLMFMLSAFILIVVPKITHADADTENVIGSRTMTSPETVSSTFHFTIERMTTTTSPIIKVTATMEGKTNEMNLYLFQGRLDLAYETDFSLGSSVVNGVKDIIVTATDANGYSASHTYQVTLEDPESHFPVAQLLPANEGNVKSNEQFDLIYRLLNVGQAVYGQDVSITFNSTKVDFVSAKSLNSNFKIIGIKKTKIEGNIYKIRIIISSLGQQSDIASGLIKLRFLSRSFKNQTDAVIELKKVGIADNKGNETLINSTGLTIVIGNVDKTLLNKTLAIAQSAYDAATEGNSIGNYTVGSKSILKAEIDKAKLVSTNFDATKDQVNLARTELEKAITTFQNSVILPKLSGDLNNDSVISIGDVGIMSSYSGKSTLSPDWNIVKAADLNKDGVINTNDLYLIANLILG
jgi:beta-glucosidase